jgi:DNA-binding Lrp family transcriptional regulator
MLDLYTRQAVFALKSKGHGIRAIARALKVSKNSVREVLRSGQQEVPRQDRLDQAAPHVDAILEQYGRCKGNLVRVWEELVAKGIAIPYSTLTAACRRRGIGVKEKQPAGEYDFAPGKEMQHDTSPHKVEVADRKRLLQCAALWLGYSRMLFAQCYPTFNRFYCKVFLNEAFKELDGAAERCTIDNTSVIVAHGSGKDAVMAPEMAAFAERFGFAFVAHAIGDVNRSAGAERTFHYIENNFYPGRDFASLCDLNRKLRAWCIQANQKFRRHLQARPVDLYRVEQRLLKPLPLHIPEVYALHRRSVDLCGYVHVHTNRYSAPPELIGREVDVRESIDRIRIFDGHKLVSTHERNEEGARARSTLPEHRYAARWQRRKPNPPPLPEELVLRAGPRPLGAMVDAIKARRGGRAVRPIRELHRMYLDYPEGPLSRALDVALKYGVTDIARIEEMVLKQIAGDFFRLGRDEEDDDE